MYAAQIFPARHIVGAFHLDNLIGIPPAQMRALPRSYNNLVATSLAAIASALSHSAIMTRLKEFSFSDDERQYCDCVGASIERDEVKLAQDCSLLADLTGGLARALARQDTRNALAQFRFAYLSICARGSSVQISMRSPVLPPLHLLVPEKPACPA